jgi:hypothetical protein
MTIAPNLRNRGAFAISMSHDPPLFSHADWLCDSLALTFRMRAKDRANMKSKGHPASEAASANISKRIGELGDWRGETLARVRRLIHDADADIEEEWKWRGVPVWSHDGIVCTGESYKEVVKLTFARGASMSRAYFFFFAARAASAAELAAAG